MILPLQSDVVEHLQVAQSACVSTTQYFAVTESIDRAPISEVQNVLKGGQWEFLPQLLGGPLGISVVKYKMKQQLHRSVLICTCITFPLLHISSGLRHHSPSDSSSILSLLQGSERSHVPTLTDFDDLCNNPCLDLSVTESETKELTVNWRKQGHSAEVIYIHCNENEFIRSKYKYSRTISITNWIGMITQKHL